jgi:diguanylate cyclase (GGDEF)-like protein
MALRGISFVDGAFRLSLRERIAALLAALVFLIAVALGGLLGQSALNEARSGIGQSLATDAQRLAERLGAEMAARTREIGLLANVSALRDVSVNLIQARGIGIAPALGPALAHTQSLLDGLRRNVPAYTWIAVADPDGRVLAATDPASVGTTITIRPLPGEGLRGREPLPRSAAGADRRVMDLVQPVRAADGNVVGVVAAQLAWSWVRTLERDMISIDTDGVTRRETLIVGAQDQVLIGPLPAMLEGTKLALPAVARARAGFTGWSVETWPALGSGTYGGAGEAGRFLTGTAFVAGEGVTAGPGSQDMRWTVLVRESEYTAFAPAYALRRAIWLAGGVAAAAFAGLGWLLATMMTRPLRQITAAAERLRQGDDVELPRFRGPLEIDSLSLSLRALVASLTRKQLALEEMQQLALRDPLTGVLNRHGMRLRLEAALAQAQSAGSSLMVFVGDLDGFKQVNDTLGHAAGDALLCQVAQRLVHAVRAEDIVARTGGDEFVLALAAPAGLGDPQAMAVILRAQAAVTAPYELQGRMVTVGCSLGGASWPEHLAGLDPHLLAELAHPAEGFDLVMERADAALYTVKRTGKGRVLLHGESPTRMESGAVMPALGVEQGSG